MTSFTGIEPGSLQSKRRLSSSELASLGNGTLMLKYNIKSASSQQEIDATSEMSKNSSEKKFQIDPVFANTIYDKHKMVTDTTHI